MSNGNAGGDSAVNDDPGRDCAYASMIFAVNGAPQALVDTVRALL